MTWVARCHHVLGIEHLLRQLGHGQGAVLLAATRRQRSEAGHEKVQSRERHHVDGELAQVGVELAGETQAGGDAGHGRRHKVVEVAISRRAQFQCAETDVVQCLVVNTVCLVCVFDQLMDRQCSVVWLDYCVGNLQFTTTQTHFT